MIRTARGEDLPALMELSRLCFGDSEEWLGLFYSKGVVLERDCWVWEEEGKVPAMAFTLPCLWRKGGAALPCIYLYSVATHPQWRGRGLSTKLLEGIWQGAMAQGCQAAILVPGEESLFEFYRKRGYRVCSWLAFGDGGRLPEAEPLSVTSTNAVDYFTVRERLLGNLSHCSWGRQALAFQQEQSRLLGGGLYLFDGGAGCCVVERWENQVYCKELLAPRELVPGCRAALAKMFPDSDFQFRLPIETGERLGFSCRPFAMARYASPLGEEIIVGGYFALALD